MLADVFDTSGLGDLAVPPAAAAAVLPAAADALWPGAVGGACCRCHVAVVAELTAALAGGATDVEGVTVLDGAMDADAGRELLRDVCGCCQRTLVTGLLVSLNCCSDSAVLARRMSCTCTQPALVPSASSVPSCLADRLLKELPRGAAMLHTACRRTARCLSHNV